MFRLYIPIAFVLVFAAWILYRFLIKKDLKQQLNSLSVGLFFTGVWAVIYIALLRD
ncbi:MAG: hypothetical protein K0S33_3081 [Bacteroidetes bacterium]|jgi:tellurite resistance protein TehA-like permease|nr:hypothetical protein [Bacteroidota bacterium]